MREHAWYLTSVWYRNPRLGFSYRVPFCIRLCQSVSTGYQKLIFGTGTQLLISPSKSDLHKYVNPPAILDLHFICGNLAWTIIECHYYYYCFVIIDHNNAASSEYVFSAMLFFLPFKENQCHVEILREKCLSFLWNQVTCLFIQLPPLCWGSIWTSQSLGFYTASLLSVLEMLAWFFSCLRTSILKLTFTQRILCF